MFNTCLTPCAYLLESGKQKTPTAYKIFIEKIMSNIKYVKN